MHFEQKSQSQNDVTDSGGVKIDLYNNVTECSRMGEEGAIEDR